MDETSWMLFLRPDLVRPEFRDRAVDSSLRTRATHEALPNREALATLPVGERLPGR